MKINDLKTGLDILSKYGMEEVSLEVIPKCFEFSSAPKHSYQGYLLVEVHQEMDKEDVDYLLANNWICEQEGDVWLFGNHYNHK